MGSRIPITFSHLKPLNYSDFIDFWCKYFIAKKYNISHIQESWFEPNSPTEFLWIEPHSHSHVYASTGNKTAGGKAYDFQLERISKSLYLEAHPQRPIQNWIQQHAPLFFVCLCVPSFTFKPKAICNML